MVLSKSLKAICEDKFAVNTAMVQSSGLNPLQQPGGKRGKDVEKVIGNGLMTKHHVVYSKACHTKTSQCMAVPHTIQGRPVRQMNNTKCNRAK